LPIQQILLYTFVVILGVGLLFMGYKLYQHKDKETARDMLRNEIYMLAKEALRYYYRPQFLGGGAHSFEGFMSVSQTSTGSVPGGEMPQGVILSQTDAGTFVVTAAAKDSTVVDGVGIVIGSDGETPVHVQGIIKIRGVNFIVLN
jgi:hypothetical protein